MEIRTIGSGIDVDSALDAYVKRRIHFALGRFSSRVERVSVVLSHENGPDGGMGKTCVNQGSERRVRRIAGHHGSLRQIQPPFPTSEDLRKRNMDEENLEYTVRCNGAVLWKEFGLQTAINRAYEESESRPNEPVEVRRRGESYAILWRVEDG